MIHRPNVHARCFVPNIQARYPGNRKYYPRKYRLYVRQCRWCHRPKQLPASNYPFLCDDCATHLYCMEIATDIRRNEHDYSFGNWAPDDQD